MKKVVQVFTFDLIAKALSTVAFFFLIRVMPESEYAQYVFVLSILYLAIGTVPATLNRIYIVGHEKFGFKETTSDFLGLQLIIVSIIAVILLPFTTSVGDLYGYVFCLIVVNYLAEYAKTIFQQQLRFLRFSMIDTLENAVFTIGLISLYLLKADLSLKAVVLLQIVAVLGVFIILFNNRLVIKELFYFGQLFSLIGRILRSSYSYLIAYFFILAFFSQVDVFMTKILSSDHELATYGSAFKYYTVVILVLNSFHIVILPLVQRAQTQQQLNYIYKKHSQMLLLLIPIILLGAAISPWLIPLIDGGKYPEAIPVFRILSLSAIISITFSPYANLTLRFEDFKFLLGMVVIASGVAVILNLLLTPSYGAIGVAISTLIASATINIAVFIRSFSYSTRLEEVANESVT